MEVDAERLSIDEVYPPASTPIAFTPPSEFGAKSSSEQNSQTQFLVRWKGIIQPKFVPLLSTLSQKVAARSLLLSQIYTFLPVLMEGKQMLKAEDVCLLGSTSLEQFHQQCHADGLPLNLVGPMSKVWENGDVQVVQYPSNLPENVYPMDRMPKDIILEDLGELVFLPVYDAEPDSSTKGILAVIELMIRRRTSDAMIVATLISTVAEIMESLGLSLSAPESKPNFRSRCDMRNVSSFQSNNNMWENGFDLQQRTGQGMCRTISQRNLTD